MFFECENLEEIEIPASVIQIDSLAFNFCPSLKKVYFGGTKEQWIAIVKERNDNLPNDEDIICASDDNSTVSLLPCDRKFHKIEMKNTPLETVLTQSARKYNPDLAYTLSVLASDAYDYKTAMYNLWLLGYSDSGKSQPYFNRDIYELSWEQEAVYHVLEDHVGYGILKRQLDQDTLLVLVVIRGTFGSANVDGLLTGNEWLSDYNIILPTIFGSGEHTGFFNAEKEVMEDLTRILSGIRTENVKYVITGHSRGVAVANLLENSIMTSRPIASVNIIFQCSRNGAALSGICL